MKKVFLTFILCIISLTARAEIKVSATVDRDQVTLEDEIELVVSVSGGQQIDEPIMPSMPAFGVVASGMYSSQIIINGNARSEVEYHYVLIPQQEGTFTIDPITVSVDGNNYQSAPITINVSGGKVPKQKIPQYPQDPNVPPQVNNSSDEAKYWIEQTVSNENPYQYEEVLYTFRLYTNVRLSMRDKPQLPDFKDFTPEIIVPEKKYEKDMDGGHYVIAEIVFSLIPLETGEVTLEHAELAVEAPSSTNAYYTETKVIKTKELKLNIKPLPQPAPPNYTNLIGSFDLKTSIDPKSVHVGEPANLTVTMEGKGNIRNAVLPMDLDDSKFKTYAEEPKVDTIKTEVGVRGSKVFKIAIVPLESGSITIPGQAFSYFNPKTGQYEEVSMLETNLEVAPSQETVSTPNGSKQSIGQETDEIAPLHTELTPVSSSFHVSVFIKDHIVHILLFSFSPLIPIFIVAFLRFRKKRNELNGPEQIGRKAAKLFQAELLKSEGNPEKILERFKTYIGNRCGVFAAGLTRSDIDKYLEKNGVDRLTREKTGSIVSALEAACYSGGTTKIDTNLTDELKSLVNKIDSYFD